MVSKYDFTVLKTLRKEKNISLEKLADISGLNYTTVIGIESNKKIPSLKSLTKLCDALEVSPSYILTLAEKEKPSIAHISQTQLTGIKTHIDGEIKFAQHDDVKMFTLDIPENGRATAPEVHANCHELCCILQGKIEINIEEELYELNAQDTIYFDSSLEHRFIAKEASKLIIVHIPNRKPSQAKH